MKIVYMLILTLLSMTASAQSMICPNPTYQMGNLCCFNYNDKYNIDMIKLTNDCSAPYKHIDETCCAKFTQLTPLRTASIDENNRKTIYIRSPYDNSIMRIEETLYLNYEQTPPPLLSSDIQQKIPTPQSSNFEIDTEILTMFGILILVVICVIIWILKGKDE